MPIRRASNPSRLLLCALAATLLLLAAAQPAMAAGPITVNTTEDGLPVPGEETCTGAAGIKCTLREAIEAANASAGEDTISFAGIAAGSVLEIEESSLPAIEQAVTLDGHTAAGASTTAPAVELIPVNMGEGAFTTGFAVHSGTGTRIEGFAIGGFSAGIEVAYTGGGEGGGATAALETEICGNYLGTELLGEFSEPNVIGVEVWTNASGAPPQGTVVGSPGTGCPGNVISGNSSFGVADYGLETTVAGNAIGLGPQPAGQQLPNGTVGKPGSESAGVYVAALASGTRIGHADLSEEANIIVFNSGPGVFVEAGAAAVSIRHDSFSENEGLGIEIAGGGPPVPTITSARSPAAGTFEVEGTVEGEADGEDVAIEVFGSPECDPSGSGEGQTYLGRSSFQVEAGPNPYAFTLAVTPPDDDTAITATVTREDGTTTEFSTCAPYEPPPRTLTVTTTEDISHGGVCGATCSLRDAIEAANELPNHDLIDFGAAAEGTIALGEAELPPITEPLSIDGTLAPGWTPVSGPRITIDGTATSSDGPTQGLLIEPGAQGSSIAGIAIENFDSGATVVANHASFDHDRIAHNRGSGVRVTDAAPETSIRRTTLFADGGAPIEFEAANTVPEPEVESFQPGPDSTVYLLPFHGIPDHTYGVDVFADALCEQPGGFGPAEVLVGSEDGVTTDESGEALAEVHGPALTGIDAESLTATATDLTSGTTSQIGKCARTQPETEIESGPFGTTPATAATFTFSGFSYGTVAGYECSLDAADFSPCSSPQQYTGLTEGGHTFRVRAVSTEGARDPAPPSASWTVEAAKPPPAEEKTAPPAPGPPPTGPITSTATPVNGETIVVKPQEGKVKIKLPGTSKYVPLEELKEIPVGAVIDATKGKVTLTSINPDGTEQTANFFGGVFKVKQKEGSGLVVLELLDTGVCPASGSSIGGGLPNVLARAGKATSGKLWGSGHGNFRTEGNQGSATVRGTIWLVEDRCDGTTFFRTRRGVVSVRDFFLGKTVSLPAGKTYVAGEG